MKRFHVHVHVDDLAVSILPINLLLIPSWPQKALH